MFSRQLRGLKKPFPQAGASASAAPGGRATEWSACGNASAGAELDPQTLVWMWGRDFPLATLESRLKCPRCGSRRVRLTFSVPAESARARA